MSIRSFVALTFLSVQSFAAPNVSTSSDVTPQVGVQANILKGNFEAGGTGGIAYSNWGGTQLNLSPTFKYFFMDRFAFGITGSYTTGEAFSMLDMGPSADYYFYQKNQWAFLGGLDVLRSVS